MTIDLEDRHQLRVIRQAVDDCRLSAHTAVRSYRNGLLVAILTIIICAVVFPIMAFLLTADIVVLRAPSTVAEPSAASSISTGDLASIEVWGVLGGLIGAIVGLRRMRTSRDPAGLHLTQLALKLPAGAMTALFGVVLLQSGIVPPLKPVASGQIAAYAVLFGFAQEALTRFVDRQSARILDNAKPQSDKTPPPD